MPWYPGGTGFQTGILFYSSSRLFTTCCIDMRCLFSSDLQNELLMKIFKLLRPSDILRCSRVCKRWYEACDQKYASHIMSFLILQKSQSRASISPLALFSIERKSPPPPTKLPPIALQLSMKTNWNFCYF